MPDSFDPGLAGVPDEATIARIANAMFNAATHGFAAPAPSRDVAGVEGIPVGTPGLALGGFGASLPSTPLPDLGLSAFGAPQPTAATLPASTPAGASPAPPPGVPGLDGIPVGTPGFALGAAALPASTPEGAPPAPPPGVAGVEGIPVGTPGLALGGFGAPLPAAPQPELGGLGFPQPTTLARPKGAAAPSPFGSAVPASLVPGVPSLGLDIPGADELRALLAAAFGPDVPAALPADAAQSYYFVSQPPAAAVPSGGFDVNLVRRDFPILSERVNGRPLVWLDNAATTQKPQAVIDRLGYFYEHENSNIHRAAHELAARATDAYEKARETVRRFVNAGSADEIVFVRGTTEAINLISNTWGRRFIGKGDEILVTWLEHHANIVPWQMLCEQTGAILRVAPVDDRGQVKLDDYGKLLGPRTKLVSFTHVSNALGTVTPAKLMTEMAHAAGARVLLDGAQSVSHLRTDVAGLDVDWFVFSGHKVFGPTGIGAVYGKPEVLAESPPWQGGGNMIADVTFEHTEYKAPPSRFEAGTGNIADAVGLGAALEYVERVGIEAIGRHEHDLLAFATGLLGDIPGLRIIGTAPEKAGVISFVLDGIDPVEVGTALNEDGIAVRAGHHCAQPILRRFGLESTVRLSLALYNTYADIDALASSVRRIQSKRAPHKLA